MRSAESGAGLSRTAGLAMVLLSGASFSPLPHLVSSALGLALKDGKEVMLGWVAHRGHAGHLGGTYTLGSTKHPHRRLIPVKFILEDTVVASGTKWF